MRKWAEHMLLLIAYSATALGFLFGVLAVATWLTVRGYGVIADVLVLTYLLLSLPIFLAQIGVVADLMLTLFDDPSVFVPALQAVADRATVGPVTRVLAAVLTTVSLFSSVSTWALSMLRPSSSAIEVARMKYRTEAGVLATAFGRIVRRRV